MDSQLFICMIGGSRDAWPIGADSVQSEINIPVLYWLSGTMSLVHLLGSTSQLCVSVVVVQSFVRTDDHRPPLRSRLVSRCDWTPLHSRSRTWLLKQQPGDIQGGLLKEPGLYTINTSKTTLKWIDWELGSPFLTALSWLRERERF